MSTISVPTSASMPPSPTTTAPLTAPTTTISPTPSEISSARAAVVASISNIVDPTLTHRAHTLHRAAASISSQTRQISKDTQALFDTTKKLALLVGDTEKRRKEMGALRNWAEYLEREMLIIDRTIKAVKGEISDDSDLDDLDDLDGDNNNDGGVDDNNENRNPASIDEIFGDSTPLTPTAATDDHSCPSDFCPDCDGYSPMATPRMSYVPDPLITGSLTISSIPLAMRTGPFLHPLRPRPLSIVTASVPAPDVGSSLMGMGIVRPRIPASPVSTVASVAGGRLRFLKTRGLAVEGLRGDISLAEVGGCGVGSFAAAGGEGRNALVAIRAVSSGRS